MSSDLILIEQQVFKLQLLLTLCKHTCIWLWFFSF